MRHWYCHRSSIYFAASLRYETVTLPRKELKILENVVTLHAVASATKQTVLVQFEITKICYLLGLTFLLSQDL